MKKNSLDNYNEKKEQRKELGFRLDLGLRQLKKHPFKILSLLFLLLLFLLLWKYWEVLFPPFFPEMIIPVYRYTVDTLLTFTFLLFAVLLIKGIGINASQEIEAILILVFDSRDLHEYGYPKLVSVEEDNKRTIMIFYSHIPVERWKEKKGKIEEETEMKIENIDYREQGIKSNYKKVIFLNGTKREDQELRYKELDEEIEHVD